MDLQKFLNESLTSREATLSVPELKGYFGEDKPEWTVRGLTAIELARANEISEKGPENIKSLIEAIAGEGDKAEALRKSMGLSQEETPQDITRRIEMLCSGSVKPVIGYENRDVAVKLAETFPTTFFNLTNKILSLTGMGAELGKRKPSGKGRK